MKEEIENFKEMMEIRLHKKMNVSITEHYMKISSQALSEIYERLEALEKEKN